MDRVCMLFANKQKDLKKKIVVNGAPAPLIFSMYFKLYFKHSTTVL